MQKDIIHDPIRLSLKSVVADKTDAEIGTDLLDTLKANSERCVGMAANMIGVNKRIICFIDGNDYVLMFNPEIIKASGSYTAAEGCLSLSGTREAKRYRQIKVKYENSLFQSRIKTYSGFTAQIIQHEIDHCNGILI